MDFLTTYQNQPDREVHGQIFAARFPVSQPGGKGSWDGRAYLVQDWDSKVVPNSLHGVIQMQADGWIRIELDDFAGWRPFIALAGMDAGRTFQAEIAYGWEDGSVLATHVAGDWNGTMTLYEMIGEPSTGALAQADRRSHISVAALDRQPWRVVHAIVGWMRLP